MGPLSGALNAAPEWGPGVGPRSGGPEWDPGVGPRSGGPEWDPGVGARSGGLEWGLEWGPSGAAKKIRQTLTRAVDFLGKVPELRNVEALAKA